MNSYSQFVKDSFNIISEVLPNKDDLMIEFAVGEELRMFMGQSNKTDEHASLKNKKAIVFYRLIYDYADFFGIDPTIIAVKRSPLNPKELYIRHSCYAKNIRRWIKEDTVGRKKIIRVEYVVLLLCWSMDWFGEGSLDKAHIQCRNELAELCKRILKSQDDNKDSLLKLLWEASCKSYTEAYKCSSKDNPLKVPKS